MFGARTFALRGVVIVFTLFACSRGEAPATRATDSVAAESLPPPPPATTVTPPPVSPAPQEPIPIRDFAARVGVTSAARDTTLCLSIANADLREGTELLLISAQRPQRLTHARVGTRRNRACTEMGDEWGSVNIPNASYYRVEITDREAGGDLTIAIVGPVAPFSIQGDALVSDLDGDGRAELFNQCASNEGIHLTIVTPGVTAGGERWHQYFYVPYDLEPSCPGVKPQQ